MKEPQVWVYGFEAQAGKVLPRVGLFAGLRAGLGRRGGGLHRLVREACDELAHIPLRGPVPSLNVSVAAAVVLYEARANAEGHRKWDRVQRRRQGRSGGRRGRFRVSEFDLQR